MAQIIEATFDGQVFRPLRPVGLAPDTCYRLTIEELGVTGDTDVWSLLAQLAGTLEAPSDWSSEHDHYLYGTPKQQETN